MSSLNIIKKYPELLELAYLSEREREHDLHAIFKRDIEDNCQFSFRGWRIYPIKTAQWKFSGDKHKSLQVDTERTFHQRYPLAML